jgi:hypothetical protein
MCPKKADDNAGNKPRSNIEKWLEFFVTIVLVGGVLWWYFFRI